MGIYFAMCIYLTLKSKKQKQDAKLTIMLFYVQTQQLVSRDSEYFGLSRLAKEGAAIIGLVALDMESTLESCVADLNVYRRFIFKVFFAPVWMWLSLKTIRAIWNYALQHGDSFFGKTLRVIVRFVQNRTGGNFASTFMKKLDRHDDDPIDYDGWLDLTVRDFEAARTFNLLIIFVFSPITMECLSMTLCRRIGVDGDAATRRYLKSDLAVECQAGEHLLFYPLAVVMVVFMAGRMPQKLCMNMSKQVKTATKKAMALHEQRTRRLDEWEARWRMSAKARAERFGVHALRESLLRLAIATTAVDLAGNVDDDDVDESKPYKIVSVNGKPISATTGDKALLHQIDMAMAPVIVKLEPREDNVRRGTVALPLRDQGVEARSCIIELHEAQQPYVYVKGASTIVAELTDKLRSLVGLGLVWYKEDHDDHNIMDAQMELPMGAKKEELVERVLGLQFTRVSRSRTDEDPWLADGLMFSKRDFDRQILKAEYGNMLAYIAMKPSALVADQGSKSKRATSVVGRLWSMVYKALVKKVFVAEVIVKLPQSLKELDQEELERFCNPAHTFMHDPFDMPLENKPPAWPVPYTPYTLKKMPFRGLVKVFRKLKEVVSSSHVVKEEKIVATRVKITGKLFWPPWIELCRKFWLNMIYLYGDKSPDKFPWKMWFLILMIILAVTHQYAKPYADERENRLEVLALLMLVVVTHLATLEQFNPTGSANFAPFEENFVMPGGLEVGLNERILFAILAFAVMITWFVYISRMESRDRHAKLIADRKRLSAFWSAVGAIRLKLLFLGVAVRRLQQLPPAEAYHVWERLARSPVLSVRFGKEDIMKALAKATPELLDALLPRLSNGRLPFGRPSEPEQWSTLSSPQKEAAIFLGYSAESWPDPVPSGARWDNWQCLSETERTAAGMLGICCDNWPPQPLADWAHAVYLRDSLVRIADTIIVHEVLEIHSFEWKLFKQWVSNDSVVFTGPFGPAAQQDHHLPEDQRNMTARAEHSRQMQLRDKPTSQMTDLDEVNLLLDQPIRGRPAAVMPSASGIEQAGSRIPSSLASLRTTTRTVEQGDGDFWRLGEGRHAEVERADSIDTDSDEDDERWVSLTNGNGGNGSVRPTPAARRQTTDLRKLSRLERRLEVLAKGCQPSQAPGQDGVKQEMPTLPFRDFPEREPERVTEVVDLLPDR
jgi:hypothetical protein